MKPPSESHFGLKFSFYTLFLLFLIWDCYLRPFFRPGFVLHSTSIVSGKHPVQSHVGFRFSLHTLFQSPLCRKCALYCQLMSGNSMNAELLFLAGVLPSNADGFPGCTLDAYN